jgi:hypothetical protein
MFHRPVRLLIAVILPGLMLAVVLGSLATPASSQGKPPAATQPNPLLDAIHLGKWPAQVTASNGAIRPDRHGPQRNDPAEGIPKHAYSPFDERVNREYPCPPGGCEFQPGRVLIKLAPQVKPRRLDLQGAWTEDAALNKTLEAQGVVRLEPVFPNARPPKPGEFVVSPQGEPLPKPDLTRWYRTTLRNEKADVHAVAQALREAAGVAWAEPDYLRKPVGEPVALTPNPSPRGREQG